MRLRCHCKKDLFGHQHNPDKTWLGNHNGRVGGLCDPNFSNITFYPLPSAHQPTDHDVMRLCQIYSATQRWQKQGSAFILLQIFYSPKQSKFTLLVHFRHVITLTKTVSQLSWCLNIGINVNQFISTYNQAKMVRYPKKIGLAKIDWVKQIQVGNN